MCRIHNGHFSSWPNKTSISLYAASGVKKSNSRFSQCLKSAQPICFSQRLRIPEMQVSQWTKPSSQYFGQWRRIHVWILQRARSIYPEFESDRRACAESTWPPKCRLGLGGLIGPRAVALCQPWLQGSCHRHFGRDRPAHGAWATPDCTGPLRSPAALPVLEDQ